MLLDLNKIKFADFPKDQFVPRETEKKQIVLHHTVSGRGVEGDINYWLSTSDRIATHFIVDWQGIIYQCFSSKYWGYHLGVKEEVFKKNNLDYQLLDDNSIGIEIDSFGGLTFDNGVYRNAYGGIIPMDRVVEYPNGYRGYSAYEKYTVEQIKAVKELILYFHEKYGISIDYNEDMWDISKNALQGKSGVWSHTSFREDKSDCHPQIELVDMLKSLNNG